jgi:hypothetical protein
MLSGSGTLLTRPSACFDAIDTHAIVVVPGKEFNSKGHVAFVPITDITGPVGVIQIKGFIPQDDSELKWFERPGAKAKEKIRDGNFK